MRRLKPREEQLLKQIKENDKMSIDLQSKLQVATDGLRCDPLLPGCRIKKGVLPLLQDEIDRFTAKIETQAKAEALQGHAGAAREGCGEDDRGRRLSRGGVREQLQRSDQGARANGAAVTAGD